MKVNLLFYSIFSIIGFYLQEQIVSQDMFVKDNTFIYVNNQYVYIKNDLELNGSNSNFYLRNDGQLLQGTTGSGANKGVGSLSVFQEGTVNNFQYNYWCSPVGTVSAGTGNNPFGISLLGRPTSLMATTAATILSSNAYDGTASPLSIAPYWIYKFIVKSSYSDWVAVGSASTINPGEGYTMKGTSGTDTTTINSIQNNSGSNQRYDFRGKPNDGTIDISVLPGELTLTGNPYPSAIDLKAFLTAATNSTGVAYFWEQDKTINSHYIADYKGGYGTYSPAGSDGIYTAATFYTYDGNGSEVANLGGSGNNYKRKYSPIGQGFMIEGSASGNVQMKNSYRVFIKEGVANLSQFEKRSNTKKNTSTNDNLPQIRFNTLLNNGPISQMVLAFDPQSTDGVDHAMDAASPNDGPANNYFVINNNEYIIEVMPFDIDKKIPIGFRNNAQANYKITVNEMLNIPEVSNVYIHDKITDLFYDIKNSFYDLTLPAGTYNTRYEITFKNSALGIVDMERENFQIHQDNVNKNLIINNPMEIELTSCSIYDVAGRLILKKNNLETNSSYSFSTSNFSNGIYIVKITSNEKSEMCRKIIVKN